MLLAMAILAAACGDAGRSPVTGPAADGCANVVDATAKQAANGTWAFSVTVASSDAGRYADAWEVRAVGGTVLGTRELLHPHVDEQPFTRSLSGVAIPDGTTEVVVVARDSVEGFCGEELTLQLLAGGW